MTFAPRKIDVMGKRLLLWFNIFLILGFFRRYFQKIGFVFIWFMIFKFLSNFRSKVIYVFPFIISRDCISFVLWSMIFYFIFSFASTWSGGFIRGLWWSQRERERESMLYFWFKKITNTHINYIFRFGQSFDECKSNS